MANLPSRRHKLVFMIFIFLGGLLIVLDIGSKSLPKILRRVAYPVEPFGFKSVQNGPPPPLLGGNRDRLGEQPGLFDQLDDCQANELQCVHRRMQQFSLNSPQIAAIS